MSHECNDVVCSGHFVLDGTRLFHSMESCTWYVTGLVCEKTSVETGTSAFETVFLAPLWSPYALQDDKASTTP